MVLKALILVGGYGTRLRPLTFTKAKPMVEFINIPIVMHQILALAEVGVKEVILAVAHKAQQLEDDIKRYVIEHNLDIKVLFSFEEEPLGTAGPIRLAEKLLDPSDSDPFFMLNADVISQYHFDKLLDFHKNHKSEGTIYVTPVKDPSRFGVVVANDKTGEISQFVEKPKELKYGNLINAGLYIFNKAIINRIPKGRKCSIETDIFPVMAKYGHLFRLRLQGYWMDLGTPTDFIRGQGLYLEALSKEGDPRLWHNSADLIGNVIVHSHHGTYNKQALMKNTESKNSETETTSSLIPEDTVLIGGKCKFGPNVVIGPGCKIGNYVRIKNSCIMGGTVIKDGAYIDGSLIGWNSKIGSWARLQNLCILGEDVEVQDETNLVGTIVCPHKNIKESCMEKGKIIL